MVGRGWAGSSGGRWGDGAARGRSGGAQPSRAAEARRADVRSSGTDGRSGQAGRRRTERPSGARGTRPGMRAERPRKDVKVGSRTAGRSTFMHERRSGVIGCSESVRARLPITGPTAVAHFAGDQRNPVAV